MNELYRKYAEVLLNTCLDVEDGQPLYISYNKEIKYFIDIVIEEAKKRNIEDIYLEEDDVQLKHDLLKEKDIDYLKSTPYWNRSMRNVYTKKDAAFLLIVSEVPGLMEDIDAEKIVAINNYSMNTRKEFDDARSKSELAWCICAVPTLRWGEILFPNSNKPLEELWDKMLDMCLIKEDNPKQAWKNKLDVILKRADILNSYQFKKLVYKSSNATDFSIELPDNHLWQTAYELLGNGKRVLVNFPTEEIFTSPKKDSANGIVYSSKPLNYNGVDIDRFWIEFKDGKAINFGAEKGEKMLKEMINICPNNEYLGEVSLVPYDSPIQNINMIFKETLFDENAACHLALGDSFPECIVNGTKMNRKELARYGLNHSDSHVDFMIGCKDLNIVGIKENGEEVPIFIDGNFSSYFNV